MEEAEEETSPKESERWPAASGALCPTHLDSLLSWKPPVRTGNLACTVASVSALPEASIAPASSVSLLLPPPPAAIVRECSMLLGEGGVMELETEAVPLGYRSAADSRGTSVNLSPAVESWKDVERLSIKGV
eukprot:CAMPEP_0113942506 /NCGR_PEP_ID=MMETSP1339-20121228/8211_1 /TAXON_ID=94617 /ORGANISM="Fibrocapsa japonica" /LENGTH=131 /DNA_ID=CAMNT_0000947011 /DNA_START=643 /DNA_END=1035 /DNA_ORIENTATION=- /assembly_acc=CAM_ASM_000762